LKPEPITWDQINQAFAPFRGTCLYSIRADCFFHFALRERNHVRSRLKNIIYPCTLARAPILRARRSRLAGKYLFVCDYAAEPGFGTLRPLLLSSDEPGTVVANRKVASSRSTELANMPHVNVVAADSYVAGQRSTWRALWRRSEKDFDKLYAAAPEPVRKGLNASVWVVRTILLRAYLYERLYEELFAESAPRAVITHNDFTSLSYLAGEMARRMGVADFTLQHGFPSQEYFPVSASHYLLWGPAFLAQMREKTGAQSHFAAVGAPRLDALQFTCASQGRAREKLKQAELRRDDRLNVLFLSQSHSPVFTADEHSRILALVAALAAEQWIKLSIRRHPQESPSAFRLHPILRKSGLVPAHYSLADSVLGTDVALSVNSTAMLEAALLETPVLQLALPEFCDRLGVLTFPGAVADFPAALSALQELRNPDKRERWMERQKSLLRACICRPGHGTEAAWSYIRSASGERIFPKMRAAQGIL
jgi:hypothetical protein